MIPRPPGWRWLAALAVCLFVAGLGPTVAPARAAQPVGPHRYALSMFHFNIQYVPGGLVGFVPLFSPDSLLVRSWEIDDLGVEDRIVTESFEPVLDLYLAHPGWGIDIEFQGLFLEVLAARHAGVLEKLKRLVASGQAEVLSFHYSDQLFLAFPRDEWERSQDLTRATFERLGIPLSKTVFTQEGQAGTGMIRAMAERGYGILGWPVNLFRYQHGEFDAAPYYRMGDGVEMIVVGKDVDYRGGEIQTEWTFFDDGEKLATGDWDPYFTPFFRYDPEAVARYERKVLDLEASGYSVSTIRRYVEEVRALGIEPADPPPLLDGTWQPKDTDGIRRWLGGMGLWSGAERDNDVRSLEALAHREMVAAETIARAARIDSAPLEAAWRLLSLAEVSDASGINPYRGEIEYGIVHATEALRIARDVIEEGKARLGIRRAAIDVASGTVEAAAAGDPAAPGEIPPRLRIRVDGGGRAVTERWSEIATGRTRVQLDFAPGSGARARELAVTFPGDSTEIVYCPGLDEDRPVRLAKSAFSFDRYQLALANGLIGLGSSLFVVKDMARVHVAATVQPGNGAVTFSDSTAPADEPVTWVFHVVDGGLDEAVDHANRLNVRPRVVR